MARRPDPATNAPDDLVSGDSVSELPAVPAEGGPAAASGAEGPNLNELERVLATFASEYRPAILRAELVRLACAQQIKELESALNDLEGREKLVDGAYAAAKKVYADQRADLNGALDVLQHGIIGARNG